MFKTSHKTVNYKLIQSIFTFSFLFFIAMPLYSNASSSHSIFVDVNATGSEEGSSGHPYHSIGKAMENADEGDEINVKNGVYDENVEIKEDVTLIGEDQEDTIISSSDKDWPTVTMNHKSKIMKFTIKDSKTDGVRVNKKSKAEIIKCTIRDNDGDGIDVREASVKDSKKVVIKESKIIDNRRAGIYAETRKIVIEDNEIENNKRAGVDLGFFISASLKGNTIKNNKGAGIKIWIDGSTIWTKHNSISKNRDGIEVNSNGRAGNINIQRAKIRDNDNYAISRIQRAGRINWSLVISISSDSEMSGNGIGNVSHIF